MNYPGKSTSINEDYLINQYMDSEKLITLDGPQLQDLRKDVILCIDKKINCDIENPAGLYEIIKNEIGRRSIIQQQTGGRRRKSSRKRRLSRKKKNV